MSDSWQLRVNLRWKCWALGYAKDGRDSGRVRNVWVFLGPLLLWWVLLDNCV